jgi:peptidoglycan/LPS O-acetylase OafA/YrhL
LFLLIYVGFQAAVLSDTMPSADLVVRCLFFLQNLAWPNPNWIFGHSWSLCVEEWFYLLTASTLLLTTKLFSTFPRRQTWAVGATVTLFVVGPVVLRFALRDYFDDLRMVVVLRLDAIIYGVLMAMVRSRLPEVWRRPGTLFALGAAAAVVAVALFGRSPTATATALTLMPIGFACLLPACCRAPRPTSYLARWVERISIWSYSMYLCHTLIYLGMMPVVGYNALEWWEKLAYKAVALSLIVAVSAANYRFFEKPMTDCRDRLWSGWRSRPTAVKPHEA